MVVHCPARYSLNSFTLNGDDGQTYYYTHLATVDVKQGQKVKQGQRLGTVGAYNGKNPHLHFAVREGRVCDVLLKCTPADTRPCR